MVLYLTLALSKKNKQNARRLTLPAVLSAAVFSSIKTFSRLLLFNSCFLLPPLHRGVFSCQNPSIHHNQIVGRGPPVRGARRVFKSCLLMMMKWGLVGGFFAWGAMMRAQRRGVHVRVSFIIIPLQRVLSKHEEGRG